MQQLCGFHQVYLQQSWGRRMRGPSDGGTQNSVSCRSGPIMDPAEAAGGFALAVMSSITRTHTVPMHTPQPHHPQDSSKVAQTRSHHSAPLTHPTLFNAIQRSVWQGGKGNRTEEQSPHPALTLCGCTWSTSSRWSRIPEPLPSHSFGGQWSIPLPHHQHCSPQQEMTSAKY